MEWTRSDTLVLALNDCAHCHGSGLRMGRKRVEPCNCVLRGIFRICYARFVGLVGQERYLSRVSLHSGHCRRPLVGRKDEEYIADFTLVSKRVLSEFEGRLFRYHFLLGADWKLCARQLRIDRGTFFHAVYRIQQKLGRVFRELEPYALYPLDEYFHGPSKIHGSSQQPVASSQKKRGPLRPPVEDAATWVMRAGG
ncbi:MAG TPA: hypothetical protein VK752_05280 [Bryobacteraceae bacterium]|jgi:hypothetical protein|nr:hypothetical protein [Bryobacteraceae bacterium]